MLNRNKYLIVLLFCTTCYLAIAKVSLEEIRKEYQHKFFNQYKHVHQSAVDTLKKWKKNNLMVSDPYQLRIWQLDSVLFFNQDSTLMFTCFLKQSESRQYGPAPCVEPFKGVRFGKNWYFYFGNEAYYMGSPYNYINTLDSLFLPLPFRTLSEYAFRYVSGGAIRWDANRQPLRDNKGNFVPNEKFFDSYFNKWRDEAFFRDTLRAFYYEQKVDTAELNQLRREIVASKRPQKIDPITLKYFKHKWLRAYPWYRRWFDRKLRRQINAKIAPHIPTERELWRYKYWHKPLP